MLSKHFIRLLAIVSLFVVTSKISSADQELVGARTAQMVVPCDDAHVIESTLKKTFQEEVLIKGSSASKDTLIIYMNKKTRSYTIVRYNNDGKGCVIDAGEQLRPSTGREKEI